MIDAAVDAGADCVKFQMVFADEIIHPLTGKVSLPGGKTPLYEHFKRLERDWDFYRELKEYVEKRGALFLCTPFGTGSAQILHKLEVKLFKIASPELNHFPLLEEVSNYDLPVILSTGVSTLGDIEKALKIVGDKAVLLHCITSYPAPYEEYNLRVIPNLMAIFGLPVGVSDHSTDPVLVPTLSAAVGGCIIEKHFTLSRKGGGLDDPIALEPEDFSIMVKSVRKAEEEGYESTLNRLCTKYGEKCIHSVLGSGKKRVAPSERNNYFTTRRSVHAVKFLPAGTVLSRENTALLRTEKNLRPGLPPELWDVIIGKKCIRDIPPGEGVVWDDLL
ncbi:MAG: spore coat protein [Spirochaetes bacterium]|nr:MAG: spore coat protein [Spirochaetota bacterium]